MKEYIDPHDEELTAEEIAERIAIIYKKARDLAGECYEKDHSEKFRANWSSQEEYARYCWKSHVEEARSQLVAKLADDNLSVEERNIIWSAIVLERKVNQNLPISGSLQIRKDSPQFWGDKYENRKILEKFGKAPNFRAWLMRNCADLTKH